MAAARDASAGPVVRPQVPRAQSGAAVDVAFEKFWEARNPGAAAKAAERILETGIGFDDAWTRLRRGRSFSADVPKGVSTMVNRTSDGLEHTVTLLVPAGYDPARSYQVCFQLHGGVDRRTADEGTRERVDRLPGTEEQIYVFPSGWREAAWWHGNQVENMVGILDRLRRRYHIDENRVHLTGISDGGTGAYFMAFRETTPWASFVPLNGSLKVLSNTGIGVDGQLYIGNLTNKPFFIVNGGQDRLYPTVAAEPYINLIRRAGATVVYRPQPDAGHDVSWWPSERDNVEAFVRDHPRDPLPDRLSWETERTDRYNRAHWLIIDKLGTADGESRFDDANTVPSEIGFDFGMRVDTSSVKVRVSAVIGRSAAEAMGLKKGDLLLEIDGRTVGSTEEIIGAMQKHPPGTDIVFLVERRGQSQKLATEFPPRGGAAMQLFPRTRPSGRVDVVRTGNRIDLRTRGVRELTLLVSPDDFDLDRPVMVVANGKLLFEGKVEKDVATLFGWAARDNDRTMLFAAELKVQPGVSGSVRRPQ